MSTRRWVRWARARMCRQPACTRVRRTQEARVYAHACHVRVHKPPLTHARVHTDADPQERARCLQLPARERPLGSPERAHTSPGKEEGDQASTEFKTMAMNFQENVTLAMAVFTILASIYFFNKAQQ
ncbi:uncharacterized protein LOC118543229 [Halichoerus grypus]